MNEMRKENEFIEGIEREDEELVSKWEISMVNIFWLTRLSPIIKESIVSLPYINKPFVYS